MKVVWYGNAVEGDKRVHYPGATFPSGIRLASPCLASRGAADLKDATSKQVINACRANGRRQGAPITRGAAERCAQTGDGNAACQSRRRSWDRWDGCD